MSAATDDATARSTTAFPSGLADAAVATKPISSHDDPLTTDHARPDTDMVNNDGAMAGLVAATERDYTRSKWTLLFTDSAVEAEYVRFIYVDAGAYGAKMYALAAAGIWVLVMLWYHHGNAAPAVSGRTWYEGAWAAASASFAVNVVALGLLFVPALAAYREWIFFALIGTHWPGFASSALLEWHERPANAALATVTGCLHFCTLVALPRFAYMLWILTVSTAGTYVAVGFIANGGSYFDTHSRFEMWLWAIPLFAVALLPVFERRSRDAFVETRRAQAAIALVDHQVASMRFAVAALFPPTPTLLALAQRRHQQQQQQQQRRHPQHGSAKSDAASVEMTPRATTGAVAYEAAIPATDALGEVAPSGMPAGAFVLADTCVVQTDIAGFTAFASKASMAEVIGTVGRVFAAMDAAAAAHGVEKVHTVGDCFVGAVFASRAAAAAAGVLHGPGGALRVPEVCLARRALSLAQFALAVRGATSSAVDATGLDRRGAALGMRVGVHVGTVVAALVGAAPPKCDLFDAVGTGAQQEAVSSSGEEEGDVDREPSSASALESSVGSAIAGGVATGNDYDAAERLAVTHTALMESSGRPGFVHASRAFIIAMRAAASPPEGEAEATVHGVLFQAVDVRLVGEDEDAFSDAASNSDHPPAPVADEQPADRPVTLHQSHSTLTTNTAVLRRSDSAALTKGGPAATVAYLEELVSENAGDVAEMLIQRVNASQKVSSRTSAAAAPLPAAHTPDDTFGIGELNIFTLRFRDPATEEAYVTWLRGTSFLRQGQAILLAQGLAVLIAEAGLAPCPGAATDRAHVVLAGLCLLGVAVVLFGAVVEPRRYLFVITPIYHAIGVAASLMLTTTCLAADMPNRARHVQYAGELVGIWFTMQPCISVPLCLDQPMLLRVAVGAAASLSFGVLAPIRQAVLGDSALVNNGAFAVSLVAYATAGYFADLSLRRGFAATLEVRETLASQRGQLAAVVAKAADVMLPAFVNRAIAQAKAKARASAALAEASAATPDGDEDPLLGGGTASRSDTEPTNNSRSGNTTGDDSRTTMTSSNLPGHDGATTVGAGTHAPDAAASMNAALEAASAVAAHRWHFDFPLPVCFVTFDAAVDTVDDGVAAGQATASAFPEAALIAAAEAAARRANANAAAAASGSGPGVHKVKSIGRRVLFVAGLEAATREADANGECGRPHGVHALGDAVAALVDVALELQAAASAASGAVAEAAGGPGRVTVTAGVHCGPCFGAVLGLKRAVFDVFGDGVNTASRMESTATRGTVQLSEEAAQVASERSAVAAGARRRRGKGGGGAQSVWSVEPAGTVEAKGKGTLARFVAVRLPGGR